MLKLNGGVADAKVLAEQMIELDQNACALRRGNIGDRHMTGQSARLRAEAPDVQVVHIDHALDGFHAGANFSDGAIARRAFEQDVERFAHDADAGPENEGGDEQGERGIDPVLPGEENAESAGDDGSGGERVAGHVNEGRAHIHVAGHPPQQRRNYAIHDDAGGSDDHHQARLDDDGCGKAMDGFDADPQRDDDERGCIDESGEHAGALIAEGLGVVRGAGLKVDRDKTQQKGEKVGYVVPGLREQRQGVGAQSGNKGNHHIGQRGYKGDAQHDGSPVCARPRGRRVDMHELSVTGDGYTGQFSRPTLRRRNVAPIEEMKWKEIQPRPGRT